MSRSSATPECRRPRPRFSLRRSSRSSRSGSRRREDLDLQKVEIQRDIKELDVKLETGLRELDVKLESQISGVKRDIKELEMRLLIRLGALLMIGIGAVATLVKLL